MNHDDEQKPLEIVRTWTSSMMLPAADSRQRQLNEDYHPPVHQDRDGVFYSENLKPLARKDVPAYILEQANDIPPDAPKQKQKRMTMAEAMQRSGAVTPGGQLLRS